jgi:hypothetical protein
MRARQLIMLAASCQGGGNYTPSTPGPDLITQGAFNDASNWTLIGGPSFPTISGGTLNFTAGSTGDSQAARQTLVGGSSPAGTYQVTLDAVSVRPQVTLLRAANEGRGASQVTAGSGTKVFNITATGEVSKIQMSEDSFSGSIDNVKLQLLT